MALRKRSPQALVADALAVAEAAVEDAGRAADLKSSLEATASTIDAMAPELLRTTHPFGLIACVLEDDAHRYGGGVPALQALIAGEYDAPELARLGLRLRSE